jgi:hypothetical protein
MNPIPSRAEGVKGKPRCRMIHRACHNGDHEHDCCFHQFGFPRADAWDNPQRADRSEDEARPKHQSKIEHSSFQNRHDSFCLSVPAIVATLPRATRTTIGYEQNTSGMSRLRPL